MLVALAILLPTSFITSNTGLPNVFTLGNFFFFIASENFNLPDLRSRQYIITFLDLSLEDLNQLLTHLQN